MRDWNGIKGMEELVTLLSKPFCMVLTFGTMIMFHIFKKIYEVREKNMKMD